VDAPSASDAPRPAGSIRSVAAAVLALAGTRFELLGLEAREEAMRVARALLLGAIAVFLLGASLVFLGALLVVAAGDEHRILALVAITVIYAGTGAGILAWVRASWVGAPTPFSATAREIKADVDGLMGRPLKRP
jgi:uncharacterized membrane protein YqjE